jgi:Asp-tRNA(Asn)/Glu-tRNA(Gln) amidotransferase C subunit
MENNCDFLISNISEMIFTLGRSYIVNHTSCLADFDEKLLAEDYDKVKRYYLCLIQKMDDLELKSHFARFFNYLTQLYEIDNEIIQYYCDELNYSQKSRKDLNSKVFDYLYQKKQTPPEKIIQLSSKSISIIPEFEKEYRFVNQYINNNLRF